MEGSMTFIYSPDMETWGWFSYFPSQVTPKLDKRQLYNCVWTELSHRHSQPGWRLSVISSYPWYHLWIYCKQSFYPQLQMFMAQMTRSALSAQKIKVCDINYVPSPETRFCFHLCCGELTFTWRQVFTILRLNLVIMWISKNTKFIIFFQWSTSIKWILPEVPPKNVKNKNSRWGFISLSPPFSSKNPPGFKER